jgi:hypothetical protein
MGTVRRNERTVPTSRSCTTVFGARAAPAGTPFGEAPTGDARERATAREVRHDEGEANGKIPSHGLDGPNRPWWAL